MTAVAYTTHQQIVDALETINQENRESEKLLREEWYKKRTAVTMFCADIGHVYRNPTHSFGLQHRHCMFCCAPEPEGKK